MMKLSAPFPYPGGKSRIAHEVWSRFGDVPNYIEPFAGSLAVLLNRPHEPRLETVNDKDAMISNFWRAMSWAPAELARECNWPVNEADLHARHQWLVNQRRDLAGKVMADPRFFDVRVAAWWVWGISQWIGGQWCFERTRPWKTRPHLTFSNGIHGEVARMTKAQKPYLTCHGRGVHKKTPNLTTNGTGVHRKRPRLTGNSGTGIHRVTKDQEALLAWFGVLAERLRRVRVCCGDFRRVLTDAVLFGAASPTAVFLDPPYSPAAGRDADLYAVEDTDAAVAAREWAIEHGDDSRLRIALCGYEGEHDMPGSWRCVPWTTQGGYAHLGSGRGRENARRERIWFSPHCLIPELDLFESTENAAHG